MKVEKVFENVSGKTVKMKVIEPDMDDLHPDIKPSYYAIIPANVRYSKNLCPNAKLLFGEITALSSKEGYCWASNKYFADLYGVSIQSISGWVKELRESGFVFCEMLYKPNSKEIDKRYIKILEGGTIKKVNTPIKEKFKDINTSLNITRSNIYYENIYFKITEEKHNEYKDIYKNIDIDIEYKKMKIWLDENPKKRKITYGRFISNWLNNTNPSKSTLEEKKKDVPRPDPCFGATMLYGDDKGNAFYADAEGKKFTIKNWERVYE